jgi:hypothetical protein
VDAEHERRPASVPEPILTSGVELLAAQRPAELGDAVHSTAFEGRDDLLREAQLTDVGFDALASTLCLVMDLRAALGFPEADVAVVVLQRVRDFSWRGPGSAQWFQPWYVTGSRVGRVHHAMRLDLDLLPAQGFAATADTIEVVAGRSELIKAAQPDLTEASTHEVRIGFPRLQTRFAVTEIFRLV